MPVGIVDVLEMVEVDEEQCDQLLRTATPDDGVLDPLTQQDAIRQTGQDIVDRPLVRAIRRVLEIGPGLGVDQIGGRYVGQCLGRGELRGAQCARGVPVQIESTEPLEALTEREGEHGGQTDLHRPGCE